MRLSKVLAAFLFVTLCAAQSAHPHPAYDNFNHRFLRPDRWITSTACFTENGAEQECVREIENGKLHLAHRNFGATDSDTGFQFGDANVAFVNPASITAIATDMVVRNIEESACAVNPEFGGGSHIDATFFNVGTGDPNDDVGGHLTVGRNASDPPGQLTVYGQISQGNNYFAYFPFGTVAMGTPVSVKLTWDQPNHQFLVSWTNRITHIKTDGIMPYNLADTTPATNPSKVLTVNTFPANCTTKQTWVFIDATFDNVYVN